MARKKYVLGFEIDTRAAEAGAKRVAANLLQIDKAGKQAGSTIDKLNKLVAALQGQQQSAANAATNAANQSAKAQQAAADRAAAAQKAAADRAAAAAVAAQARAAAAAQRAADKQVAAAQKAADKQAKEAAKAAAAAAKAYQDQQNAAAKGHTQAAAAAAKASKAAEAARTREMVGIDQLRMSGLRMIDEQRKARERADAARVKSLTQEQVIAKARDKIIKESNRQRINEAAGIKDHYGSYVEQALAGNKRVAASVVLGTAALSGMVAMIHSAGAAFTAAGEKSREMTKNFNSQRDDLTELANVMDKPLTNKFTLDFAKYNAQTGFKPSEGKNFLTEMYNSGAQYVGTGKGKHMSEEQFEKFKVMAGQFSVVAGIDPNVMGDLAGNILGSTDFNVHGDKAAQEAMATLNRVYQVGKRGRGSNSTLLAHDVKATSLYLRENRKEGILQDPAEVMAGISVLAERNPDDAETYFRRGIQGLRAINDKKAGPLLEKAGISKGGKLMVNNPFEAAKKLGPVLRAEAASRGGEARMVDILGESFDEREAGGIAALIEGVEKGVVADRLKVMEDNRSPEKAISMLKELTGTEAWKSRQADSENQLAEMQRGSKFSELDVIRRQVAAKMLREGKSGTNASEWKNWAVEKSSFGVLGPGDKVALDEEVQKFLISIERPGTKQASMMSNFNFTPQAREHDLNQRIARMKEAGSDPVQEAADLLGETRETNRLLKEQLALQKQAQAANIQPKAAPVPNAQKGPPSTLGSAAQQMGF